MIKTTFYKDKTNGYIFNPTETKTDGTNNLIAVKNPLTKQWLDELLCAPFYSDKQPVNAPIIDDSSYDIYNGKKTNNLRS